MDDLTIKAYDASAAACAAFYRSVTPGRMYEWVQSCFHPGGRTADIGCGSGRDTAWLQARGFAAVGYDASRGMLAEAVKAYPQARFGFCALPGLAEIPDESFDNVLCSATLMHVGREDLITAVLALARILKPGGRLLVSVRRSGSGEEREADGRLFTDIPPGKLALLFESAGLHVLFREKTQDPARPWITWTTLVAERNPESASRGLERVQAVLMQDKKVATYKLALIRALCEISRTQSHLVRWEEGSVLVPLWSVAVHWLRYYWPFVTAETFVAQIQGERPGGRNPISFRRDIETLVPRFAGGGLVELLRRLDDEPEAFAPVVRRIAKTIQEMPIRHAGTTGERLFTYERGARGRAGAPLEEQCGWVRMPEPIWQDISRFSHWIEDSLVLQWANLTANWNRERTNSDFLSMLLQSKAKRDTDEVHRLLEGRGEPVVCVWTGKQLRGKFEVDHLIPYAVWGNNDWWNMLPSDPVVNHDKSDALPHAWVLNERREAIVGYWRVYSEAVPARFSRQISRALGISTRSGDWERVAFAGLQEAVEQLATTRGLERWRPRGMRETPAPYQAAAPGRMPVG